MSEGFLQRWSRRKAEAGKAPAETPPDESGVTAAATAEAVPDLTAIEDLTATSDYRQFMQDGVPAALRALALRKLWQSDPTIAAMDLLDIHNLDYGLPAEDSVASAWTMAQGYLSQSVTPSSDDNTLDTATGSDQLSGTEKNDPVAATSACETPAKAG
jgi:hypothetical protein